MDEQQWTPAVGLTRALGRLLVRSVIALVIWAGLVWLTTPVLNFLILHWAVLAVTALVLAAPGAAIAHALWSKLCDTAGMSGWPIAGMVLVFGLVVVVGGVMLANAIRPLGHWQYSFTMFGTATWLTVCIIKLALTEE